ncbi:MAG: glycosyltransferase family 2 protein [Bdellovibrionales bacterium]|nr:glycosyltransferase family 2 protein [Bdellovibrionales bacterium]
MDKRLSDTTVKFTVYIASHNYGKFVEEAIESVLRQTVGDWELLLINDNSTDNTKEILERYSGDERIKIFHTEGIGLHKVCNLALKEAKGRYIIRLDGDDIFDENILLVLGNILDTNNKAAIAFPDYYLIDEFGKIFGEEKLKRIYEKNHINDAPPNGACTLFRTKVLREVGGYSDELKAQDGYYVWNKIVPKYKCLNVNLPLFYYRRHGANLTEKSHKIFEARRQIKRETIITCLEDLKPIIAVIPCRKNYDFTPNVWNQRFDSPFTKLGSGKTLLENAIEKCLASSILDYVVVACDNLEAIDTVRKYDDKRLVFIERTTEDTIRSRSIVPLLERITAQLDPEEKGISIMCYAQSPFIQTHTIEEALFTLVINEADSCFGVEEVSRSIYRKAPYGLEQLNAPTGVSTDYQKIFIESRTVLAARNKNFSTGSLTGPAIVHFVVSEDETYFIDCEESLEIAWLIASRRRVSSNIKALDKQALEEKSANRG